MSQTSMLMARPLAQFAIAGQTVTVARTSGSETDGVESGVSMMTKVKLVAAVGIALAAALLAGWIWGAAGRPAAARALQASELRSELLGARAAVLDARVALYAVNFGEASRHLEGARGLLGRADTRLSTLGRTADVRQLATARARVDDAQRMTGKLDQSANARAGEAAQIVAEMLDVTPH